MTAVAIIPARYNAQRLPAKPLADIGGKPMIQHVFEQASKARRVSKVIVATDDERIAVAVKAFGGDVVMTSPDLRSCCNSVCSALKIRRGHHIVATERLHRGGNPFVIRRNNYFGDATGY